MRALASLYFCGIAVVPAKKNTANWDRNWTEKVFVYCLLKLIVFSVPSAPPQALQAEGEKFEVNWAAGTFRGWAKQGEWSDFGCLRRCLCLGGWWHILNLGSTDVLTTLVWCAILSGVECTDLQICINTRAHPPQRKRQKWAKRLTCRSILQ